VNVSIVIATYGDEEWPILAHERAYPSCRGQGALEVIFEYQPEGTIATARNAGAHRAQGDWLCFLDADDELAPGFMSAMARAERPRSLLTPSVQRINKQRELRPTFYPEVPLDKANWLIVGTLVEAWMFRRARGFEDYPHGFEDWSLWNKCHKLGAKVIKVPRAVYRQHINPRSKHRLGWRDRRWQVATHQQVEAELAAWTP
jgi:glycosyltransferase involved in cell wall biosynthesis